jgi:cytochrome c551
MHTLHRITGTLFVIASAALIAAGCGGSDSSSDSSSESASGSGTETTQATDLPEGGQTFVKTCGGCHTLSDAGTSGAVGPKLDGANLQKAAVLDILKNGKGSMPSGLVTGEEAEAVADYVATASSK